MWTSSKHRLNFFFLALGAALWGACDDTDSTSLFRETPTARIDNTEVDLQEALTRPQGGFRAVYFPWPAVAGGFTFFMKFAEDGTVKMTSNVDADTEIRSSRYGITYGSTIELAFRTRNHIHKLSQTGPDAGVAPVNSGYGGNSSFQYDGMQDGAIAFRELRNDGYMRLEPVESEATWLPTLKELNENRQGLANNLLPVGNKPAFQVLEVRQNGALVESSFASFDPTLAHLEVAGTEDSETLNTDGYGVAFLEDRIEIQPPITSQSGDEMIRYMTPTGDGYTSRQGGLEASIYFSKELPSNALAYIEDLQEIVARNEELLILNPNTDGIGSSQTSGFTAIMDELMDGFAAARLRYRCVALDLNIGSVDTVLVSVRLGIFSDSDVVNMYFKVRYDEKRIYFTYLYDIEAPGLPDIGSAKAKLVEFFSSEKGLYFEYPGKGFVTNDRDGNPARNFSNRSFTLTSIDDPTLRGYGLFL